MFSFLSHPQGFCSGDELANFIRGPDDDNISICQDLCDACCYSIFGRVFGLLFLTSGLLSFVILLPIFIFFLFLNSITCCYFESIKRNMIIFLWLVECSWSFICVGNNLLDFILNYF